MIPAGVSDDALRPGRDELEHFADLARQYAKKAVAPMFDGEHADGDVTLLPGVFAAALDTGIASSPADGMPGRDFGIWGLASSRSREASLLLLGIVAESCGGTAMALNMQGAAANIILSSKTTLPFEVRRPSLCLQEGPWPPGWNALRGAGMETSATADGGGFVIKGYKSFCYGMGESDAWVVFARLDDRLACFAVPAGAKGTAVRDHGPRTGLRACAAKLVAFEDVRVPASARLDDGDGRCLALQALTLSWLGMASIAAGIARGALTAAKKYAGERYQGGTIITHHPIIKKLIGGSEARLHAVEASLASCYYNEKHAEEDARSANMLKRWACELCGVAVTDCLQVFGGYGYMEDFGMEKRLRDIAALGCSLGSPVYADQCIGESAEER